MGAHFLLIKSSENVLRYCAPFVLFISRDRLVPLIVKKTVVVVVQSRGRPRCGSYHLQTMLPKKVLDELVRVENETDVYRTRVAANVLCEWANQQSINRSGGSQHQT
jgi:hypothetical protein